MRRPHSPRLMLALAALSATTILMASCGGTSSSEGVATPTSTGTEDTTKNVNAPLSSKVTVRVGSLRLHNQAPIWLAKETAEAYNLDIEYVEFGRFADTRTALAAGQIDFATFGPHDIALALAGGSDNLIGVSGAGKGSDSLVVAPSAGIKTWADLKGKRVGIGSGSIAWVKFAASLQENNVAYTDLEIVNIAGAGTAYLQALERGQIDVAVVWEPFAAQAVAEGIGAYPPFNINGSADVGGQNSVLATTKDNVSNRPEVVQAMVNAYVDAVEILQKDEQRWLDVAKEVTSLDEKIIQTALPKSELSYEMDLPGMKNIVNFLLENGIIKGVEIEDYAGRYDYSFLAAKTTKSADELGQK